VWVADLEASPRSDERTLGVESIQRSPEDAHETDSPSCRASLDKNERSCFYVGMTPPHGTTTKGAETRAHILRHALALSSTLGLEGLSIGALASAVGMTKSGVYAHFDSKEALQLAVLDTARDHFVEQVVVPALQGPRGAPRVRALFDGWMTWGQGADIPGGCPFMSAAADFDDRPGPVRDALVAHQRDLVGLLVKTVEGAIEEGHFRPDVDPLRFAQEGLGVVLGYYHFSRLLGFTEAESNARSAHERLVRTASVS
jgi:AcrR family transcriptional regulator